MELVTDRQLAEVALETHWITLDRLKSLVPACRASHQTLSAGFRRVGMNDEQITFIQACALHLPFARPDRLRITPRVQHSIPIEDQKRYRVAPLRTDPGANGETVYAAMLPEAAAELASHLSTKLGVTVIPVAASAKSIGIAVDRNAKGITDTRETYPSPQELDFDSPANPNDCSTGFADGEDTDSSLAQNMADPEITTLAAF